MIRKDKRSTDVSVVIPTKNEEARIESCLLALTRQKTGYTYEIIVVDTKSTDKTLDIARKYKTRIIAEPRPGRNMARKAGSEAARGHIICFTEADCIVPPDWIETIVTTLRKNPDAVGIVGRYTYINSSPKNELLRKIAMPVADHYFKIVHGHFSFRASNCAITKKALDRIGGVDSASREFDDVDLGMRASKVGRIVYVPDLYVQTEDRRINGRIGAYMKEGLGNYYRRCILNQPITQKTYADIR